MTENEHRFSACIKAQGGNEMTTDYGGGRTHDEALFESIERDWGYRDRDDREQERMDREDAMVANYDPADHARGVDEPQSDGEEP